MKSKIFIIEDDFTIRKELSEFLSRYGFKCEYSNDSQNIIEIIINAKPDLILLDINLPYFDGFHICKEIRKLYNIPIIIVTSRNSNIDELMSINLGADDFITKPYNMQILLARINAILKRVNNQIAFDEIIYKGVILNISKSKLIYNEKEIELTKNELRILQLLFKNQGKIVSRDEIMNELWQSNQFVDDNTLTVNISKLRSKLTQISLVNFLLTKRGQGYMV